MLVQPTYTSPAGGASGRDVCSSESAAISVKLANLRDELANGEVSTAQAASRLTALLATLSDPRTDAPAPLHRFAFPRWTFGGYCTICLVYACQDPKCAATHARYTWAVCPDCKGSSLRDLEANGPDNANDFCDCTFGAIEVDPYGGVNR
jgi:hypothetical protein